MKKHFLIASICVLAFALGACQNEGQTKMATVNAGKVFQESEIGKQAKEYLEKLAQDMQNDLQKAKDEYDKATPAKKEELQKKIQSNVIEYQQKMRSEEQEVLNKLTDTYQTVLDEYRKANNLSIILRSEVIASSEPECDITDKIIEAMNKKAAEENTKNTNATMPTDNASLENTPDSNASITNSTESNATSEDLNTTKK